MDKRRFEPLCCHHLTGLYAGTLFECVFFKKGADFHTQKIHKISGTVLSVLITIRVAPFLFSQNPKRAPGQEAGYDIYPTRKFMWQQPGDTGALIRAYWNAPNKKYQDEVLWNFQKFPEVTAEAVQFLTSIDALEHQEFIENLLKEHNLLKKRS